MRRRTLGTESGASVNSITSQTWLDGIVSDLNVSRRVVAHMNPLAPDDIAGIEVAFRKWAKQLTAMGAQLPELT